MEHGPAFEIKGSTVTLMFLQLRDTRLSRLRTELEERIAQAPALFAEAPVAVDLTRVQEPGPDLPALVDMLRELGLVPIGVRGANADQRRQALAADLGCFPTPHGDTGTDADEQTADASSPSPSASGIPWDAPTPARPVAAPPRIVAGPIRSGQRVVAPDGDLIVLASVSSGAEILAGRHIHVYGPLRGRALAGVGGDTEARVFSVQFDPELVAIAGEYRVSEELDERMRGRSVQVTLEDDHLRIQPLGESAVH